MKKIACSTNVIESLWEKKEKKGKILDDQKSPTPPPSRVKWSAPFYGMISLRVLLLILTNVL